MAEKKTTARWRNARPISEAWLKFGDPALASEYEKTIEKFEPKLTAQLTQATGLWSKLGAGILDITAQFSRRQAIAIELKASLLQRIEAGEFDALGYRVEPKKSNEPVIIERSEFRRYKPNWNDDTFELQEFTYRDVRIAASELPENRKPMGRPGSKLLIQKAIQSLIAEPNSNFCDLERKIACENVRTWLEKESIEIHRRATGLTDINIAKLIVLYCPKRKLK